MVRRKKEKSDSQNTNEIKHSITVQPKTKGQADYLNSIYDNDITICIGSSGSGKTTIAAGAGVKYLNDGDFKRIVVTRPVLESKTSKGLGFLPGGIDEKIEPYIRPVFDAFKRFMSYHEFTSLINNGKNRNPNQPSIEIAPLEYMRGCTYNNSYIILDEAQNATYEQLLLFLTRMGENAKIVITGDLDQCDLDGGPVGLNYFIDIMLKIPSVHLQQLTNEDICRNKLVGRILDAIKKQPFKNYNYTHGSGSSSLGKMPYNNVETNKREPIENEKKLRRF
jgi:phosphate starvation-inducible PhoH-like protein